jgi:sirohydrochlorin ferrochelatase
MKTALIIVDHGSRRTQSNQMLEEVARLFGERFAQKYDIVEPAHMELAEPSIATAYATSAKKGATRIVVVPFFLGPGKHWTSDIPRLTAEAAVDFPGTKYHVTQTLGIDDLILDLLDKRASHCVNHNYDCEVCHGTMRSGELDPAAIASIKAEKQDATPHLCGTCPFKGQPLPAAV